MTIDIFTDGACVGNPGPGGWAAIVRNDGRERLLSGGFKLTTNNRMELTAVIESLKSLPNSGGPVTIHSDSRYVVDAMQQGWVDRWAAKRWQKSAGNPVPNADLWQQLISLTHGRQIHWHWVKGHAGHPENERVDQLAQQIASSNPSETDPGYLTKTIAPEQTSLFDAIPVSGGGGSYSFGVCRKCGQALVKKAPKTKPKPDQTFYYAYYHLCPGCGTIYFNEEAKRPVLNNK